MRWIETARAAGGLNGTVTVPGAKNSALVLLSAALLADEPVRLVGIPDIADFRVVRDIAVSLGATMERAADGAVTIDPRGLHSADIDPKASAKIRTSYYFVGALLAKFGRVNVGYPGGDDFVERPIDQHIKAFKAFGASFVSHNDYYSVEARELRGSDLYFDVITSGATYNAMLLAVRARGTTVLRNAARDPEVVDTAAMLNQMGAKISGAGTDTIRIEGVDRLGGCVYTAIPDRLIAGSFLIAAGATGGQVTVKDVIPEHLGSCLAKLREIGVHTESDGGSITAYRDGKLKAVRVRTAMYPGFATDLQQPMTALLLQAPGRSIVCDRIYPHRFNHVPQLRRLGADIRQRNGGIAVIQGGLPLQGDYVHATDIRAGISLLIAGLTAEGTTRITGVSHFDRGYADIVTAFRTLGAQIERKESQDGEPVAEHGGLSIS